MINWKNEPGQGLNNNLAIDELNGKIKSVGYCAIKNRYERGKRTSGGINDKKIGVEINEPEIGHISSPFSSNFILIFVSKVTLKNLYYYVVIDNL